MYIKFKKNIDLVCCIFLSTMFFLVLLSFFFLEKIIFIHSLYQKSIQKLKKKTNKSLDETARSIPSLARGLSIRLREGFIAASPYVLASLNIGIYRGLKSHYVNLSTELRFGGIIVAVIGPLVDGAMLLNDPRSSL